MRKPNRRLFMFRNMNTGESGLIRACTFDEALNLAHEYCGIGVPVDLHRVPRSFKLHIPIWR